VRSRGGEIGFRTYGPSGWIGSLAVWVLKLDSELLFVGDAGITEPSRPSRRWGVEFNNTWALTDVWMLEADFAWTDARFTDDSPEGNRIPGALETVVTGAITAAWDSGWFGSLRLRYFGEAPLVEDGSVTSAGSSMVNLLLGWSNQRWRMQLEVLNLLDSVDHDIDYFYASRLSGEPAFGVGDIHFHIFEPRQFRLQASWLF
jgi:outer membrane receptor protein involved in Fe transport